jgi:hypothetical protein
MFIVLLINRGNAFSVHAYVTDALGFLSPINYVIEPKGRFRNEMEKESKQARVETFDRPIL